jgi:hypothetical protein
MVVVEVEVCQRIKCRQRERLSSPRAVGDWRRKSMGFRRQPISGRRQPISGRRQWKAFDVSWKSGLRGADHRKRRPRDGILSSTRWEAVFQERKCVAFELQIPIGLEGYDRRVKYKLKFKFVKVMQVPYFSPTRIRTLFAVLRIRIGFSAVPDPAFCFHADSYPGSQTKLDPCGFKFGSWSYLAVTKSWI